MDHQCHLLPLLWLWNAGNGAGRCAADRCDMDIAGGLPRIRFDEFYSDETRSCRINYASFGREKNGPRRSLQTAWVCHGKLSTRLKQANMTPLSRSPSRLLMCLRKRLRTFLNRHHPPNCYPLFSGLLNNVTPKANSCSQLSKPSRERTLMPTSRRFPP